MKMFVILSDGTWEQVNSETRIVFAKDMTEQQKTEAKEQGSKYFLSSEAKGIKFIRLNKAFRLFADMFNLENIKE